ncbi:MAG: hypothetical protein JNM67_12095 [Bacteroidetes bacterium]|nr:hypothetical protein [Bacteroidota bacterium]
MKNAVCTLFEKHYHHGVAVLTNSLLRNGFYGDMFVGYRGNLPPWASGAQPNTGLNWSDATTLKVSDQVNLHFLPIKTDAHFTNFKAHFMVDLWEGPAKDADNLYYFDPDIVFVADWPYFEKWTMCGVAVSEDINSPVWSKHPRRVAWREYFAQFGHQLKFKEPLYVNGGFIGLNKKDKQILHIWKTMMENVAPRIGGLSKSSLGGAAMPKEEMGAYTPFGKSDQDVLNAAIEAYDGEISFAGKEGMAFIPGVPLIPHALGSVKPWKLKPISQIILGYGPKYVDKAYWSYADFPLRSHSNLEIKYMKFLIKIAAFINRFYKRN